MNSDQDANLIIRKRRKISIVFEETGEGAKYTVTMIGDCERIGVEDNTKLCPMEWWAGLAYTKTIEMLQKQDLVNQALAKKAEQQKGLSLADV